MPVVTYGDLQIPLVENESVLDALLRAGVQAPHSCKAGACGSCLHRAVDGPVPPAAQAGLKSSLQARGYFLACVCKPAEDLTVAAPGPDAQTGASIVHLELLSPDVLRVRLQPDEPIEFRAGQYVTLHSAAGLARSYSIASLPGEPTLELHVRRIAGGRMSGWLHMEARPGDRLSIVGPSGECFYVPGQQEQPLLLAGAGTGLAPLYGILQDALAQGHRGPIHLFHGALHPGGLYLHDKLRDLAAAHEQLSYTPTVLNGSADPEIPTGAIDDVVLSRFAKLNGWRGYICGDPALVKKLKKRFFLAGMASRDIFADAFIPTAASS